MTAVVGAKFRRGHVVLQKQRGTRLVVALQRP
jgi:hypothetical protein